MAHRRKLLGRILTEMGVVTEVQLDEALTVQKQTSVRTGDALLSLDYCSPTDIAKALAIQFGRKLVRFFV